MFLAILIAIGLTAEYERRTVGVTNRVEEEQATIQGITEVLAREQGKTPARCWTEALSLYCAQFQTRVLTSDEHHGQGRAETGRNGRLT